MNWISRRNDQSELHSNAAQSSMRLMCAGHETEIELVKKELFKAGISSEMRRHPIAEGLGVDGVELWVHNEQDFSTATGLFTRLQSKAAQSPKTPPGPKAGTSKTSGPKPQAEPPKDVAKIEPIPVVQPRSLELNEASSLLQKGIEKMLLHESELTGECASLHGKVEELTRALALAKADFLKEIKNREVVEQYQSNRLTSLLDTLTRERREWQEKLKSSNDAFKSTKEQTDSLSRQLQTQQAAATTLKKELAALELQRNQQERILSDARKETVAEREARVAAEKRAGVAEESVKTQLAERQDLERQIQAHAANLGSLLARVTSKAAAGSGNA
jgi:hypothetical protein